jgi:hypothetical protein
MKKFLGRIYHWFLWLLGFAENEYISDMLKRQKSRLGVVWWVLSLSTIGGLIWLFFHVIGWC